MDRRKLADVDMGPSDRDFHSTGVPVLCVREIKGVDRLNEKTFDNYNSAAAEMRGHTRCRIKEVTAFVPDGAGATKTKWRVRFYNRDRVSA